MITTVTLNASIDKAYQMTQTIENGTVMRVASCRNSAGGKGLNVARVIKLCEADVQATGLCGGFNGAYLKSLLKEDGVVDQFVETAAETRSCINILDPGYGSTEYLEPGKEVTKEEQETFLKAFEEIIKDSTVVTLSGSAPKGLDGDIYAKLIEIAKAAGKKVILDTSGALLKEGIKALPTMVKPNKDEIEALYDIKVNSREDVIEYAQKIYESGIENVVVSLGGDGAMVVCSEGMFQGLPPKVDVVNTVGCGDSMVGAFAVAFERGMNPQESLKYAVAVATANAMSPNTGNFDPAVMKEIYEKVEIVKL